MLEQLNSCEFSYNSGKKHSAARLTEEKIMTGFILDIVKLILSDLENVREIVRAFRYYHL